MAIEQSDAPKNRLSRIADALISALETHPEYRKGDRVVILMTCEDDNTVDGSNVNFGYPTNDRSEDNAKVIVQDILTHLQVIGQANGLGITVTTVDDHNASSMQFPDNLL